MTSKAVWIEGRRAACSIILQGFFRHALESLRWRSRKKLVPSPFRLDLCEEPRANRFLLAIRQLLGLFDRPLQELSHGVEFTRTKSV